jgi:hypothetical protein
LPDSPGPLRQSSVSQQTKLRVVRNGIDVSGHAQAGRIPKIGHQAALSCELSPNVAIVVETSPGTGAFDAPGSRRDLRMAPRIERLTVRNLRSGALRVGAPSSA